MHSHISSAGHNGFSVSGSDRQMVRDCLFGKLAEAVDWLTGIPEVRRGMSGERWARGGQHRQGVSPRGEGCSEKKRSSYRCCQVSCVSSVSARVGLARGTGGRCDVGSVWAAYLWANKPTAILCLTSRLKSLSEFERVFVWFVYSIAWVTMI